jgi:predicted Zn-dependent peptidase
VSARWTRALGACALALAAGWPAGAAGNPGSADGQGIHQYRLRNGLDLVVAVRPELRLIAVNLTAGVGAIDDPVDESGMAHLLEHVTLGGSVTVGSLDPAAEKNALARLDRADRALRAERRKSPANPANPGNPASPADNARLAELEQELEQAGQAARRVAEAGEILGGRLEAKGAIGLNATTSTDATQYFGWIPSESLELWISLEADRLKNPIFRRFYSEREVVLQEIAVLTSGRPTLQDRIMSAVFPTGPQAQPRAGDSAEIREIDREMALEYFRRFYRPENLAVAVVGNVDPSAVYRLCERYLGDWQPSGPAGPLSPPSEGGAAKTHVQSFNSVRSPIVFFAFPRPALTSLEQAGLDVLAELLNSPELSPLKQRMIDDAGIARNVVAESSYPSQKRPAVFLLWVGGSPGTEHEKLIRETRGILGTLEGTSDEDLAGAALQAEMRLAAELYDPPTLASLLALHQAVHDDWRRPFQRLEDLRRMGPKDIRAVAAKVLAIPEPAAEPSPATGGSR